MHKTLILVAATTLLSGAMVSAHHSYEAFDREHPVIIEGDVTRVLFANPHVVIAVQTADVEYSVEWLSMYQLRRWNVSKDDLKVGDHVVIRGSIPRDKTDHRLSVVTDIRRSSDGWSWMRDISHLPDARP
jgi:Family of unknown function (DUF6152)